MSEEEFNKRLTKNEVDFILNKNIKVYIIDAYSIAEKNGLKNKVSTILEVAVLKLLNLSNFDLILNKMKESINERFKMKGEEVVRSNINSMDEALNSLKLVNINPNLHKEEVLSLDSSIKIFDYMNNLKGDCLKVSDFLPVKDGTFYTGTTKYEKRSLQNLYLFNKEKIVYNVINVLWLSSWSNKTISIK